MPSGLVCVCMDQENYLEHSIEANHIAEVIYFFVSYVLLLFSSFGITWNLAFFLSFFRAIIAIGEPTKGHQTSLINVSAICDAFHCNMYMYIRLQFQLFQFDFPFVFVG